MLNIVCVLTNERYKTYQTENSFCRLGHAPGVGVWVHGGAQGGQLNSTTVLRFLAPGFHNTSYLNVQQFYRFILSTVFSDSSFRENLTILYPRSITTDILE